MDVADQTAQTSTQATARCSQCGAPFRCGRVDGVDVGACWCARLPPLGAGDLDPAAGCRCERCLLQAVARSTRPTR